MLLLFCSFSLPKLLGLALDLLCNTSLKLSSPSISWPCIAIRLSKALNRAKLFLSWTYVLGKSAWELTASNKQHISITVNSKAL